MEDILDLVIIGAGPAGLAAAIYARRARLNAVLIEKSEVSGGQILNTYEIDNYPGLPGISGMDLAESFRAHADKLGAVIRTDTLVKAQLAGEVKTVICENETYRARAVILALGAAHRKLGVEGEERLSGRGVSYCAVCDGSFFAGREVVVMGGGDTALVDALFLARYCSHVLLVHRRDEFRASKELQEKVRAAENIELCMSNTIDRIYGENAVEGVILKSTRTGVITEYPTQGVFIAVGTVPETAAFAGQIDLSPEGYVLAGEDTATSLPGVFAAGDIRKKPLRQVITAAADGAVAADAAEKYILNNYL